MTLRRFSIFFAILIFFTSCGIQNTKQKPVVVQNTYSSKFEEIWQHILSTSISDVKNTEEDKQRCALNIFSGGLSKCLDDPNSKYYTKSEWDNYKEVSGAVFEGVGLHLTEYHNHTMIITPIRGSPAGDSKAFSSGDLIEKIDGISVVGESLESVARKIMGPEGSRVTIQVRRVGKLLPPVKLTREKIIEHAVESEAISKYIYYIKINGFRRTFFREFFEAFTKAASDPEGNISIDNPQKSVIIDLRGNPGGYLITVKFVSYLFATNPESIVITLKEKDGEKITLSKDVIKQVESIDPFLGVPPGIFASTKIVVLINAGTASAAEIFAALLRDWLGAPLIGENTFGKGSVQNVYELSDDDAVKITSAEYFVGNAKIKVNKIGLTPDYPVINPEIINKEPIIGVPPLIDIQNDAQLKKAIDILQKLSPKITGHKNANPN